MKQKQLLIAFGALVLAACGGSIDLGPRVAAPPIQPERSPDPLVYPISLTPERNWYTNANYADADDVAPDVVFIEDGIEIYATSPNQQLMTRIPGALNLSEATMVFTVSADRDYLATADAVQPLQRAYNNDEDESIADNWDCWTGLDGWEADTPVEIECNIPNDEAFDLSAGQYAEIGVQSVGDGVEGFLRLHNVFLEYYPLGRPADADESGGAFSLAIATDESANGDQGEWSVEDDSSSVVYTAQGVAFTPVFDVQWGAKLVYLLNGPIDLVGESFTVQFTVEQAFLDAGVSISAHAQQHFPSHSEHSCAVDSDELEAGVPYTITCENLSEDMVAEEGQALRIGLAFSGADQGTANAGTVTINRLYIGADGYELLPTADNMGAWDNDNWQGRAGAPDLSFDDGMLVIQPNWDATDNGGERTIMHIFEEDVLKNLEGATIMVDLQLSDYYVSTHEGMGVQLFIQQADDPYDGIYGATTLIGDAEDLGDGWYRFTDTFTDVPADPDALRVGLKLQRESMDTGGDAGEDILLRRINIAYAN